MTPSLGITLLVFVVIVAVVVFLCACLPEDDPDL